MVSLLYGGSGTTVDDDDEPLEAGTLTLTDAPGAEAWQRVRPAGPEGHGEDVPMLSLPGVVVTEPASWGRIKKLHGWPRQR